MALEAFREEIDRIDRELIEKLEERMRVAEKIAAYKKEQGLRIFDPARESALLDKVRALSAEDMAGYNRILFRTIMELSKDHQAKILGQEKNGDGMKILVINGPNLNMLGIREPDIYGRKTYEDLMAETKAAAEELGVECDFFQSNHEGAIVDAIQAAYGVYDGIVINPAAYTHTSVAILDALKAVSIPAVEVHISAVEEREAYRQVSYVREAAVATITGEGFAGYAHALRILTGKEEK